MSDLDVFLQQLVIGLSSGMIIALIALGYSLVYGIVELINFAHGDLVMLGAFLALTLVGLLGISPPAVWGILLILPLVALFCGSLNFLAERLLYKPLRNAPKLSLLVTAIGLSFLFINLGLFWGGLPLEVFNMGRSAAAPKDFPELISGANLLGDSAVIFSAKDLIVFLLTLPILLALTYFLRYTLWGTAMRAVAQNPEAASLMGINVDKVISSAFFLGGCLAGVSAVIYSLYNNTISFQMGYRIGMDGFTAAVLGGIGNLPGAMLGGLLIGLIRAFSDQYLAARWTGVVVFAVLILVLIFRPSGLLGTRIREKV